MDTIIYAEPDDGLNLTTLFTLEDDYEGLRLDTPYTLPSAPQGGVCNDCGDAAVYVSADGVPLCEDDYMRLMRQWAEVPEDWE